MAVENLSFPEAVQFNKNNLVSKAHTFSQVVSHDRSTSNALSGINTSTIIPPNLTSNPSSFPDLNYNNNLMNHQKNKKRKNNSNQVSSSVPRLPIAITSSSAPNGTFLAYVESQKNGVSRDFPESSATAPLLSDVAKALSSLIANVISNNQELISPDTLSNLIESSLVNILCNPILGSDA
ncbi:hypothetical protein QTP88_014500 [Uroleucon formosanum]